jgi:hypothetical protein
MKTNASISARFWCAPALWRFSECSKRQRAAAVQDATATELVEL